MKKVVVIVLCIIAVILAGMLFFKYKLNKEIKAASFEYTNLTDIDLSTIPDGVYNGKFGSIPVSVQLDVTVKDHRIENINITKQSSGKGYEARDIIKKIIDAQKPKVDVISGATLSSRCIMIATNHALKNAVK
jgi:uncharacterized protein with FMN-binding domain